MLRSLYRCLLFLHPPAFRQEFAGEMLWIFDESVTDGAFTLFADILGSLARQWCLRSGSWRVLAAAGGGLLQVSACLTFFSQTIPHLAVYPLGGTWTGHVLSTTSSVPVQLILRTEGDKWVGELHMDTGNPRMQALRAGLDLAFRVETGDAVTSFHGKLVPGSKGNKLAGNFEIISHGKKLREGNWELTRDSVQEGGNP